MFKRYLKIKNPVSLHFFLSRTDVITTSKSLIASFVKDSVLKHIVCGVLILNDNNADFITKLVGW